MDGQNELEQLDESLSEMTDLLLAGEAGGDIELEGDYEAPPRASAVPAEEPPADPGAEVEQAQAAVAAAMRNVSDALDGGSEPASGAGDTAGASLREPAPTRTGTAGTEVRQEADAAMRAVSQHVARSGPEGAQQPAPAGIASPPDAAEAEHGQFTEGTAPSAPAAQDDAPAGFPAGSEPTAAPELSAGDPARPAATAHIPIAHADPANPVPAIPPDAAAAPPSAGPRAGRAAGMIGSGVSTLLAIALEPVAARLAGTSRTLRHSLAWLAVWTAFNGACVWAYIALFRTTSPGHGEGTPTHIVGAGGSEASYPEAGESEKTPAHEPESAAHGR